MALPPVVAELRANIGDYVSKMRTAREEWSATGDAIGRADGVRAAETHLRELSHSTRESVRSTEALRETSGETFRALRAGLGTVVPGFGELSGTIGLVGRQMRETRAVSRDALTEIRAHQEALKVKIERTELALAATSRQMLKLGDDAVGFERAQRKALALSHTISGLNRELALAGAEERKMGGAGVVGRLKGGGKLLGAGALGGVAVGAAVAGAIGYEGVKAAMAEQAQLELLKNAVSKTGVAWHEYEPQLESVTGQMRKLGVADGDTMASAQALTSALKNPEKALNLVGLAANVARARHIDMATATAYVAKVATGHVGTLGRLGLASTDAAGKTLTASQAIKALGNAYGGASAAYSHTLKGQLGELRAQTEHVLVKIGNGLIPVLERMGEGIRHVAAWTREHIVPALRELVTWVGDKLLPPVEKAAKLIGHAWLDAVRNITSHLHKNHEAIQKVVTFLKTLAEFIAQKVVPIVAHLIAWALKLAGVLTGWVVTAISKVVDALSHLQSIAGKVVQFVINNVLRPMASAFLGWAKTLVDAAADAFGWVPGIGTKLKQARAAVDTFVAGTDATLAAWASDAGKWGDAAGSNFVNSFTAAVTQRSYTNVSVATALGFDQKPKVEVDPQVNISSGYDDGIADVVKKTKQRVAHHLAKHNAKHGKTAAQKAEEAHKKALAALAARLKKEAELALEQARKIAAAREAMLRKQLAAAQELARQLDVQNKLNGSAAGHLDIIDGAVLNRGTSFAQLARQGGGVTVNVNVAGTVTSEKKLTDVVHQGLLAYSRQNIGAGLS